MMMEGFESLVHYLSAVTWSILFNLFEYYFPCL